MKQQNLIETKIGSTVVVEQKVYLSEWESYVSSLGRVYEEKGVWSYKVHGTRKEVGSYSSYKKALAGLLLASGAK